MIVAMLADADSAATAPRLARPFSNSGPHILSQSIKRLITLPMKPFEPYMLHVTSVLPVTGLKVKSRVLVPCIGSFQSILKRTSSPGLLAMIVLVPAPTLLSPFQLHTAPTPEGAPENVFRTFGSSFIHGFHFWNLWWSLTCSNSAAGEALRVALRSTLKLLGCMAATARKTTTTAARVRRIFLIVLL